MCNLFLTVKGTKKNDLQMFDVNLALIVLDLYYMFHKIVDNNRTTHISQMFNGRIVDNNRNRFESKCLIASHIVVLLYLSHQSSTIAAISWEIFPNEKFCMWKVFLNLKNTKSSKENNLFVKTIGK